MKEFGDFLTFSSLGGTLTQSGARVIRQIHPGIKMETKFMKTMRVTPLLCFLLQKKCIRKCLEEYKPSNMPTIPDELADEENDPVRPPSGSPRPSFPPPMVSSVCFIIV